MFIKSYEKIKKYIKENYKFILTLVIILLVFLIELPYAIYTPGGEIDLAKRVNVENGYKSSGKFGMTYVSLVRSSLPFVLASYIIPNWDLVPAKDFTYDDMSVKETLDFEKLYMQESVSNATYNAYKYANKKIEVKSKKVNVVYIAKEAKTDIKLGDEIISVEGNKISDMKELQEVLKEYNIGDVINCNVKRNNKEMNVKSTLIDYEGEAKIGIVTLDLTEYKTNPKIDFKIKSSEAGSSGGLMMSLAIYNSLVKKDITHGKNIVGTGTIDSLGNVGEIDGIKYKIIGAVKNKADIFLCPYENYEEAIKVKKEKKYDIIIVKVKTFEDAVKYLENIKG